MMLQSLRKISGQLKLCTFLTLQSCKLAHKIYWLQNLMMWINFYILAKNYFLFFCKKKQMTNFARWLKIAQFSSIQTINFPRYLIAITIFIHMCFYMCYVDIWYFSACIFPICSGEGGLAFIGACKPQKFIDFTGLGGGASPP